MQSVSIPSDSIDNLDILKDVLAADDSIMDFVVDSERRDSLISNATSLMHDYEDEEEKDEPIATTTTGLDFTESSSSLPQPHRHRVVSLEGQGPDERQRYFLLESSYQNSSACSIEHILPEAERVERPDWSMIRPPLQPTNDVGMTMMMIPSPFNKLPKSQEHSPNKTTIISAARQAQAAAAAAADSNDEMFMSSAEFAECCIGLLDSSNISGSAENNNNDMTPFTKSSDKLFSTGELATLCNDFPSLLVGKAHSRSTPTTAPSSSSSAPFPMFTSSNIMDDYDSAIFSLSDLTTTHPTSVSSTQLHQPEQQPQPQVEGHDENTDVVVPTRHDVKCGRGGDTIQHNLHFIDMCEAAAEAYATINKRGMDGKLGIVMAILNAIAAKEGRFIKQECCPRDAVQQWQVLSTEEAINKTSHCIRDILKRRKNEQLQSA